MKLFSNGRRLSSILSKDKCRINITICIYFCLTHWHNISSKILRLNCRCRIIWLLYKNYMNCVLCLNRIKSILAFMLYVYVLGAINCGRNQWKNAFECKLCDIVFLLEQLFTSNLLKYSASVDFSFLFGKIKSRRELNVDECFDSTLQELDFQFSYQILWNL